MAPVRLYRPDRTTGGEPSLRLAGLPTPVGGMAMGVLHNRKMNAGLLMGALARNLATDVGGDVVMIDAKDTAQVPCPDPLLARAAELCALVFTGSGD